MTWQGNKYGAKKTEYDGIVFASKREAGRYAALKMLQQAGVISGLRRQVPYLLIDTQRIGGKVAERKCVYVADFVYEQDGKTVVEDCKGVRTEAYKIKRKLMLKEFGIRIRET